MRQQAELFKELLIGSLVRGAPETGLGEGSFAAVAPTVLECLRVAEDRDVLQVPISLVLAGPLVS